MQRRTVLARRTSAHPEHKNLRNALKRRQLLPFTRRSGPLLCLSSSRCTCTARILWDLQRPKAYGRVKHDTRPGGVKQVLCHWCPIALLPQRSGCQVYSIFLYVCIRECMYVRACVCECACVCVCRGESAMLFFFFEL